MKNKEERLKKQREYNREYYKLNKEKILESRHKYYISNIDKRKEYCHNYDKNNRDKRNKYRKEKYDNDPIFRLRHNMSSSINRSLKAVGISKEGAQWEKLTGYTRKELKNHLEKLFKPGMNWKNRGEWHIDHIIPISFFRYSSVNDVEFKYCWSLDNLQPLWEEENIAKSDNLIFYDQDR